MRVYLQHGKEARIFGDIVRRQPLAPAVALLVLCCLSPQVCAQNLPAQSTAPETAEQKVEHLTAAVAQAQAAIEDYQKQLTELRQQLASLKQQMAAESAASALATGAANAKAAGSEVASRTAATLDEIRERQAVEESQIATHDAIKVETE